jgi:coenzyme F420-reducing hydrogenase delta subunit
MALTRKFLAALGIEADKVDEIIKAHSETVDGLKEQIDSYKADAEKLPAVTEERDKLKEAVKNDRTEELQKKYDDLNSEYDSYKSDVKGKEVKASQTKAYKELLKEAGVSEKRIDTILKVTDLSKVDFDKENNVKDADKVKESIKSEWADFITTTSSKGADTTTPPANTGGAKTKDEILAIKDPSERQAAIAENHELFGI